MRVALRLLQLLFLLLAASALAQGLPALAYQDLAARRFAPTARRPGTTGSLIRNFCSLSSQPMFCSNAHSTWLVGKALRRASRWCCLVMFSVCVWPFALRAEESPAMTALSPSTISGYVDVSVHFDLSASGSLEPVSGVNDPLETSGTQRIVPFDIASEWGRPPLQFDAFSQPAQGIPLGNSVTVVPEPGTLALLALGAGYLALASRRRFKR